MNVASADQSGASVQIRENGRVVRNQPSRTPQGGAFLGILGDDFRGSGVSGVRIRQVIPGSPADTAGLAGAADPVPPAIQQLGVPWTGHIILAVDGRRVHTMRELSTLLGRRRPGQRAVLTVTVGPGVMSGEAVVTLTERPPGIFWFMSAPRSSRARIPAKLPGTPASDCRKGLTVSLFRMSTAAPACKSSFMISDASAVFCRAA